MRIVVIVFLIVVNNNVVAQRFKFIETEEGVTLTDSGKKVFHYQSKTKSLSGRYPRANYIHPLYGFDEEELTEDFPADHYHHRGIFWTWHQIFVNQYRVGDGWDCKNISWLAPFPLTKVVNDTAILYTNCLWKSDSLNGIKTKQPKDFLYEHTRIAYTEPDANTRVFEIGIVLESFGDTVKLGASEDAKHYSGFSTRFALPNDVRFFDGSKEIIPELNGNTAGSKVTMKGSFGLHKNLAYMLETVNPGKDKQRWILRKEKSMQNIADPGDNSYIVIVPGKPVIMQYRLYITRKP